MSRFDTILVADWSAGKRRPARPSKDAIWLGVARGGVADDPVYCRSRHDAEALIAGLIKAEKDAGRRLLAAFDFPFGYPQGVTRRIVSSDDPLDLWAWLADRITDAPDGSNNRYTIAEEMNRMFDGTGPFWGKPNKQDWPDVPYRKAGITYDQVAEHRACDRAARAASSCFQLAFPPTVGGQVLMGLPVLHRLRCAGGVAVWPFEPWQDAPVVLAEIWPGLIEQAVKSQLSELGPQAIRDCEQVRLLALALSRLSEDELHGWMSDLPDIARQEAWILGAGHNARLVALARKEKEAHKPLANDCFALPPGIDWTPVDVALEDLRSRLGPVVGLAQTPLTEALGRIVARNVTARRAHPPLPNTAVDGYGFAGGRGPGAHRLPLIAAQAAAGARLEEAVQDGDAVRILTGAALPDGVDTVVLQEDVEIEDGAVCFTGPIKAGANTRAAGEDKKANDIVAARGRRITPADLALMSAVGVATLETFAPLKVGILSTGDELVEAGQSAAPGQIFDANRPMLMGLITGLGHSAVDLGRVGDDRDALRARLEDAAAQVDVIFTSGGASAGDADHVSGLLNEAGSMALWRIAIKPGRPLALGMWNGTPVFGLPGNPVAAMVCTLVFGAPALAQMAGASWSAPQGFDLPAAFEKRKKPGRREFLRARMRAGQVEIFASEGSGRISGLSWAEGLVELPDAALHVRPGDRVRYIPWSGFGILT
ncbi:MAG: molybdopterin-binding protein [Tateyamaria sp.]|nr:molybdopterin-binding protein [Tateyamaria sp.]MDG2056420.1 molybdopterin-binding protein [Tateyamaria sp.]